MSADDGFDFDDFDKIMEQMGEVPVMPGLEEEEPKRGASVIDATYALMLADAAAKESLVETKSRAFMANQFLLFLLGSGFVGLLKLLEAF